MQPDQADTLRLVKLHRLFEEQGWRLRLDLDRDGTAVAWFHHRTSAGTTYEARGQTPVDAAEAAWAMFQETIAGS